MHSILLGKAKKRGGRNETNQVPFELETTFNPLIVKDIKKVVDEHEVYTEEYSQCNKFRLTLTVKPYCTNVLFNMCTEIVKDEGSQDCVRVTDNESAPDLDGSKVFGRYSNLYRNYMVSNTEYSSPEIGYEYLPGYDIFSNHTLRNTSFRPVMPVSDSSNETREIFNTVGDYMRNNDGETIVFYPRYSAESIDNNLALKKHIYEKNNILPFIDETSFAENLMVKNGWYGFVNASSISTQSEKTDPILGTGAHVYSHTLNYSDNCSFIDLFPGRDRYTFIPKYNQFKKRFEKNWDIFLTYPWKNFYEHNLVCNVKTFNIEGEIENGDKKTNALATMRVWRTKTPVNRMSLMFRTFCLHNLSLNDKISVFLSKDNGKTYNRLPRQYYVDYIGDINGQNNGYYFSISTKTLLNDIFADEIENIFYEPVQDLSVVSDYTVSRVITEVPTIVSDQVVSVFDYIIDDTPLSAYTDEITYDSMPKTINQGSFEKIRVWNKEYVYLYWDSVVSEYSTAEPNQNIEYGAWNTFSDEPSQYSGDYIRLKQYDFYVKTERKLQMKNIDINEVINSFLERDVKTMNGWDIRFAKVVNDVECKYYVRKFMKLPNFKFSQEPLNQDKNLNEDTFKNFILENAMEENGNMRQFDSETYKLAFAKTIYGDDIVQVTFLDDITVQNLKDNLGQPVTEIYATIVKRNNGYKIWYQNLAGDASEIEYSRCFGSITSGFEYLTLDEPFDRNRKTKELNGFMSSICSIYRDNSITDEIMPLTIEDWDETNIEKEITSSDFSFFGDVVEFSPTQCKETVLSNACFRFNTAQREVGNDNEYGDFDFTYTELESDDFDPNFDGGNIPFKAVTYKQWEQEYDESGTIDENSITVRRHEGYFYNPHTKITLYKYDTEVNQGSHRTLRVKECKPIQCGRILIKVTTSSLHGVGYLNTLYVCYGNEWIEVQLCNVIDNHTFTFAPIQKNDAERMGGIYLDWIEICKGVNSGTIKLRVKNESIPEYANKIGENLFMWRNIIHPVELPETDKDRHVFSNGAFYVDETTSVYLRRQDPQGINGLFKNQHGGIVGNVMKQPNNVYKTENEILCY